MGGITVFVVSIIKRVVCSWLLFALLVRPGMGWADAPLPEAELSWMAMVQAVVSLVNDRPLPFLVIVLLMGLLIGLMRRRRRLLAEAEEAARLAREGSGRRRAVAQPVAVAPPPPRPVAEEAAVPVAPLPPSPLPADSSRLPDREPWVGRQKPLALLDGWLADPQVVVVSLMAAAGVGKTRLLQHWADRCGAAGGIKTFYWSFAGEGDSGRFFDQALPFFGQTVDPLATGEERAAQLVRGLHNQSFLLLLDGVEGLQLPQEGEGGGHFADPGLQTLVRLLGCRGADSVPVERGLVLLASRQTMADLVPLRDGPGRELVLDNLKENEATQLLHEWGIRGKFADFRPVVKQMHGHALLLTLLGRLITRYYGGSMANKERLAALWVPGPVEAHLERLLTHYERVIWPGESPYALMLRLLGLFERPVAGAVLQTVCPEIPMAHGLIGRDAAWLEALLTELQQAGLAQVVADGGQPAWQLHPLVRVYYARRWRGEDPIGWQEACRVLARHGVAVSRPTGQGVPGE